MGGSNGEKGSGLAPGPLLQVFSGAASALDRVKFVSAERGTWFFQPTPRMKALSVSLIPLIPGAGEIGGSFCDFLSTRFEPGQHSPFRLPSSDCR